MKLSQLIENENNPRCISDEMLQKLIKSISEFPQMLEIRPIIIDENNIVLGGNMRTKALKSLGYEEIPDEWVKQYSSLTDQEKKQFIIKDNIGYGDWDKDMLALDFDIGELEGWGLDIQLNEQIETIESDLSNTKTGTFTNNISSNKTAMYIGKIYGIINKDIVEKIRERYDFIEGDEEHNGLIFMDMLKKLL